MNQLRRGRAAPRWRACARADRGRCYRFRHRPADPQEPQLPDSAPTAPERLQVARGHLNVAEMAMRWGRYREASRRLDRALDLANRHRYHRLLTGAMALRAHLDLLTGAWDGLAERVRPLLGGKNLMSVAGIEIALVTGLLQIARDPLTQGEDDLRRAVELARRHGCVDYIMEPAAALARLPRQGSGGA